MSELNKLAYLLLNVLRNQDAVTAMSSMSINELHTAIFESGYSYSAVQKWVRRLYKEGYLTLGIKEGNCNTYYITSTGIEESRRINRNEEVRS